jgi:hypothetical protein
MPARLRVTNGVALGLSLSYRIDAAHSVQTLKVRLSCLVRTYGVEDARGELEHNPMLKQLMRQC